MHIRSTLGKLAATRPRGWTSLPAALLIFAVTASCDGPSATPAFRPAISKETSYITEPLDSDGCPDYASALNKRLSSGVTPGNNAAVLLVRACGPREACRAKAESEPPAANGREELVWNQHDAALRRPWSKKEFPILAAWLAAHERPLAVVVEASKRPRYFDPIVSRQDVAGLLGVSYCFGPTPYGSWLPCRPMADGLLVRAMAKLKEGQVEAAWEDILSCHRLARLVGQAPTSSDALVACAIEESALLADRALLEHGKLAATQCARIRHDLDRLAPMPKMADKTELGERFSCLSWALRSARDGLASLKRSLTQPAWAPIDTKSAREATLAMLGDEEVDWDVVLCTINSCFDKLVAAQRVRTYPERVKAIRAYHDDLMAQANAPRDSKRPSKEDYSRRLGLALVFTQFLQDDFTSAEDRAAMDRDLIRLAFVLAQYRADHGLYPVGLSELAPTYLATIPRDLFANTDLRYERQSDGYLLYSVGVNGQDDGGRTAEDSLAAGRPGEWDDLVVRMPARRTR